MKKISISHELYSWGRGYHGQLGHKDAKNVQWTPLKVKIKRDPRVQDSEQPTRFQMVTCGERHTLILSVTGALWWTGDRDAVGLRDGHSHEALHRHQEEKNSFQYNFIPYFDPTKQREGKNRLKYINSNFNSPLNFAIAEDNKLYEFGETENGETVPYRKAPVAAVAESKDSGPRKDGAPPVGQSLGHVDPAILYVDASRQFTTIIDV